MSELKLDLPKTYVFFGTAPLWKRTISFIADFFLLDFLVFTSFASVLGRFNVGNISESVTYLNSNPGVASKAMLVLFLIGIFSFTYFYYMQKNFGQTLGMKIMNLQIKSTEKKEIQLWQYALRNLFLIPVFPFVLLWVIDIVYLIIYNKRFSEIISKTLLVEEHTL